jgi:hypothetical protein
MQTFLKPTFSVEFRLWRLIATFSLQLFYFPNKGDIGKSCTRGYGGGGGGPQATLSNIIYWLNYHAPKLTEGKEAHMLKTNHFAWHKLVSTRRETDAALINFTSMPKFSMPVHSWQSFFCSLFNYNVSNSDYI